MTDIYSRHIQKLFQHNRQKLKSPYKNRPACPDHKHWPQSGLTSHQTTLFAKTRQEMPQPGKYGKTGINKNTDHRCLNQQSTQKTRKQLNKCGPHIIRLKPGITLFAPDKTALPPHDTINTLTWAVMPLRLISKNTKVPSGNNHP